MPHLSSRGCDFFPLIKANCVRFVRYDRNQSRAVTRTENLESSLLSRISWSTLSKAADRSSRQKQFNTVTIISFKQNVIVNASEGRWFCC